MKSEHRHELQTNELGKLATHVGQWFQKYGRHVLIGLAAVLVLAVAGGVFSSHVRSEKQRAWDAFYKAQNGQDSVTLTDVAENFSGSAVAAWAQLRQAEQDLRTGIRLSFTDRNGAISDLKTAQEGFNSILTSESTPENVRERALNGLARCLETTSDGNTEPAIEAYRKLLIEFPDSVFKESAQKRIDALETGASQEFYAWFHKQNPKPEDLQKPQDGLPGEPEAPMKDAETGPAFPSTPAGQPDESDKTSDQKSESETAPSSPQPGEANASETVKPDAPKPDAPKLDVAKPGAPKDDTPKPGAAKPDATK